jgi:hypothetical protein
MTNTKKDNNDMRETFWKREREREHGKERGREKERRERICEREIGKKTNGGGEKYREGGRERYI